MGFAHHEEMKDRSVSSSDVSMGFAHHEGMKRPLGGLT